MMKRFSSYRLLRWSSLLTLLGLALVVWSVIDPRPIPVIAAMTVGQGVGTLALAIFLAVVVRDLRRSKVLRAQSIPPGRRDSETPG